MHRLVLILATVAALFAFRPDPVRAAEDTPVGTWRTFDDDGKESGRVQIWDQGGILYGRVVGIADPEKAKAVCRKCDGPLKDMPVMGMQILGGLKPDGHRWTNGRILDPENGSTYDCTVRVEDDGHTLLVRGFLGISLLGRTQSWRRVE